MEETAFHYMDMFERWKTDVFFDSETREELEALNPESDRNEIEDRFYRELEFGTGGMRGLMGAGTNRMNQYTVGKATKGLGMYLLKVNSGITGNVRVAICYDTRKKSAFFAETAAAILSAMGIEVFFQQGPRPTPQLSFAVPYLKCHAGIVITASHNPKEYNGYKIYDSNGCQMIPEQIECLVRFINQIGDYTEITFEADPERIWIVDTTDAYLQAVRKQSRLSKKNGKQMLRIVYTPLHGTGTIPILQLLHDEGFLMVNTVREQLTTDGSFSTVHSPNPEERSALQMGIQEAVKTGADIVIGTDPDCDRMGIAVLHKGEYHLLTGNQVGALLMDYVIRNSDLHNIKPAVVKTVVTNELGADIARAHGIKVFDTLTGFKYIGEKINQFEAAKRVCDSERDYDFLFGYEESYGYLCGTHARDKDAAVSTMLICELATECKLRGITLVDKLEQLYAEYGYYQDALESYTLRGKEGMEKIHAMMDRLRLDGSPFRNTKMIEDFKTTIMKDPLFGALPKSDVLKYTMMDGSWVAVRPSGTEPKIKVYYSVKASGEKDAADRLKELQKVVKDALNLTV